MHYLEYTQNLTYLWNKASSNNTCSIGSEQMFLFSSFFFVSLGPAYTPVPGDAPVLDYLVFTWVFKFIMILKSGLPSSVNLILWPE